MPAERYPADQQFGAEAAKDEERAEDARGTSAQRTVEHEIGAKRPRAGNTAEPRRSSER
jgi:hypothetical protein